MTETPAWTALLAHRDQIAETPLRALFGADAGRFDALSLSACGLLLDYSKQRVTATTMALLLALARERDVFGLRDAMFAGQRINLSEQRAVLHTALRDRSVTPLLVDGHDVRPDIAAVLARLARFVDQVHTGAWRGHDGAPISDVVNIGIGGSDLGPRMVCDALWPYRLKDVHGSRVHFVSNVDDHELRQTLDGLNPATTLFVVASKTFTTLETMMNARSARDWCRAGGVADADLHRHFVAVSTNTEAVRAFGIDPANMFGFWDWVGGRFSLWSSIGLAIALQCGVAHLLDLHAGAHAMDRHFVEAPAARNMPLLLGLIGIWNINMLGARTLSIAPYHQLLRHLPNFLQQLEMESNGKSVRRDGGALHQPSAPVLWGQPGTNGQHAYFQWLHQGTEWAPVDFIAAIASGGDQSPGSAAHQQTLLANCLAQSEALMRGKTHDEALAELRGAGLSAAEAATLAPHKVFSGNRPSSTLLLPRLDPWHLGALLALYEHKVLVQGAIWDINSFDQWGVELGKVLCGSILGELSGARPADPSRDPSTRGLIALIRDAGCHR